jgi:hypothetical protein
MKKALMIALALLISVAFVTTVFAQAKPAVPATPAAPATVTEKPAKVEKAAKAKAFTGQVVNAEATALVAKDKKGEMTFDVSGVKGYKAEDYKAGDKVVVKYAEKDGKNVASAVKKAPAKKAVKKVKKEEAPIKVEPVAPPAPPAPPKK